MRTYKLCSARGSLLGVIGVPDEIGDWIERRDVARAPYYPGLRLCSLARCRHYRHQIGHHRAVCGLSAFNDRVAWPHGVRQSKEVGSSDITTLDARSCEGPGVFLCLCRL